MVLDWAGGLKPSLINWIMVGLMALTFIVLAKWLMTRYPIAGLSDVVSMA
jgi:hypothetical protein